MMRFAWMSCLAPGLLLVLSSCGVRTTLRSDAISSAPSPTNSDLVFNSPSSQKTAPGLEPGRYCYQLKNDSLTTYLRFTVDDNHQIEGDARSSRQDAEDSTLTSYAQEFSGTQVDQLISVNLTTWTAAEIKESKENWLVTGNTLNIDQSVLDRVDCQSVDPTFQDHQGLEARDLLESANNLTTKRVEFTPGNGYTLASNNVVRGDRHVYLLAATGGEQMSLTLDSLENNAAFDVISPSGYILAFSAVNETLLLPHTGDYQVIVGGTRGDTAYDLAIGIQ